jgi:hypothetical protein
MDVTSPSVKNIAKAKELLIQSLKSEGILNCTADDFIIPAIECLEKSLKNLTENGK